MLRQRSGIAAGATCVDERTSSASRLVAMAPELMDDPAEPTHDRTEARGLSDSQTSSASAAWARCTAPVTRDSIATSRSKSCRASFAADPERLARFEREARLLASLNHPHIAAIYGFEDDGGHSRTGPGIRRGTRRSPSDCGAGALPIEEAVSDRAADRRRARGCARARASCIAISNRPNIKVQPDGTVKVLDFGLAKATDRRRHTTAMARPRQRRPSMRTRDGVILGTAALHEPGAGARTRGGQTNRHLGLRLRALRDADGARAVRGRDDVRHAGGGVDARAGLAGVAGGHASRRSIHAASMSQRKIPSIDCTTSPTRESRFRRPSPSLRR